MIYSFSHKFIYVRVPRTASVSTESVLKNYHNEKLLKENIPERKALQKHSYAKDIRKQNPKLWKEFFTFAFVRNPWSRVISMWQRQIQILGNNKFPTLERFILRYLKTEIKDQNQWWWIADKRDNIIVDFVGKFENLQEDFNKACVLAGIPEIELPHLNSTKTEHYTKYYDKRTKRMIDKICYFDVNYLGYKFGD